MRQSIIALVATLTLGSGAFAAEGVLVSADKPIYASCNQKDGSSQKFTGKYVAYIDGNLFMVEPLSGEIARHTIMTGDCIVLPNYKGGIAELRY